MSYFIVKTRLPVLAAVLVLAGFASPATDAVAEEKWKPEDSKLYSGLFYEAAEARKQRRWSEVIAKAEVVLEGEKSTPDEIFYANDLLFSGHGALGNEFKKNKALRAMLDSGFLSKEQQSSLRLVDRILYSPRRDPLGGRVFVLLMIIVGILAANLLASLANSPKWPRRARGLVPHIFLVMSYILGERVFYALWLDRIFVRRGKTLVTLANDPSAYWFGVGIHIWLCIACFFATFVAWKYRHEIVGSTRLTYKESDRT